jgi:hypothetical protein
MATSPPQGQLVTYSSTDIQNAILRFIRNGLIQQGVPNPNVSINSDFGMIAGGLGAQVAVANANGQLLFNQGMPDSATGSALDRILAIYGLMRRPASPSYGNVDVYNASANVYVPAGSQLTDPSGNVFSVQVGGTYGITNSTIPVVSVSTGTGVNDPAGTVLTWVKTPPYFPPTVTVDAITPITGGQAAETDDAARARLLAYLGTPPGGGNASELIAWAQAAEAIVQTATVYSCVRGPGTYDVCVVGYAEPSTAETFSRTIGFDLSNVITPYVLGQMPQFADGYIHTAESFPIDISVLMSLPSSPNAIPAGPGGGWLDASPLTVPSFPSSASSTTAPAIYVVDGYALSDSNPAVPQNSSLGFFIYCANPPPAGYSTATVTSSAIYSLSYLSPETFQLYNATTTSITVATAYSGLSGYSNLYYVALTAPFYSSGSNGPQPGHWVFPTAQNTATYVENFLDYMAGLGPGERTFQTGLTPRALRQPTDPIAFPYRIDTRLLKSLIASGPEVYDAIFNIRQPNQVNGTYGGYPCSTYGGAFVDYGQLSSAPFSASDPAYAKYAPPTASFFFGSNQCPTFVFTPGFFAHYPQS